MRHSGQACSRCTGPTRWEREGPVRTRSECEQKVGRHLHLHAGKLRLRRFIPHFSACPLPLAARLKPNRNGFAVQYCAVCSGAQRTQM
jgi:hypothetical protein